MKTDDYWILIIAFMLFFESQVRRPVPRPIGIPRKVLYYASILLVCFVLIKNTIKM